MFTIESVHQLETISTATIVSVGGIGWLLRATTIDIIAGFYEIQRRRAELKRERERLIARPHNNKQ